MRRATAIFALAMGLAMVVVWIVYIAAGQMDTTEPLEAASLLTAELITAAALITGGLGVLRTRAWGMPVHLASLGMLLYTSLFSVGVFADVVPASAFFAALSAVTVAAVVALSRAAARTERS